MNTVAIINIARQQLGMEETDYRAMLVRVTGIPSLRKMSGRQQMAVVDELKKLGFRVVKSSKPLPSSTKPYIRMIHALWRSCYRLGVIEDGSRAALRKFCRNTLFGDAANVAVDPDQLDYAKASRVIDALKAMERRGKAKASP